MNWTIYSIGDVAYLEAIFNGLANIFGSGDFIQVVQVAFLIGVIIISVQAVFNGGQRIEWQTMLVALLVFLALFGPGTRIHLEDAYTGQVRTVDNVPLGVSAIGTIVSNAGYQITRLMEQAYGTPTQTQLVSRGFGSNTSMLSQVRRNLTNTADWADAADAGTGSTDTTDLAESWQNYVADCTMRARDLHEQNAGAPGAKSHSDITQSALPEALEFDSDVYGTKIRVGGTRELSCSDAYDRLEDVTYDTGFEQDMLQVLAARVSVPGVPNDRSPTTSEVEDEINNALAAFNVGAVNAQSFVVASALLPAYQAGVKEYHYDYREMMQAAQVNEAINQRNAQWQAQESVFESTIRPMMTFIEGLFYAIAPIIAFFLPLGRWGLSLAPKFLILAVWIQLWMPMLAIINLYQQMVIERKMIALDASGLGNTPVDSIGGLMQVDQILQNWQATGSMLASSVPILAAVIAYGGNAFMLSRLMGQMQGAENIDPSTSTPDVANTGAGINHAAAYESGINSGIAQQNANQMHPGVSISNSLSASQQSAAQEVQQNRQQFADTLSRSLQQTYGDSLSIQDATRLGQQFSSADSNVAELLQSDSETYREAAEKADGTQEALTGATVANLSGQVGGNTKFGGGKGGLSGNLTEQGTLNSTDTNKETLQEQIEAAMKEVDQAKLQDAVAADISQGRVDESTLSTQDAASSDYRQAAEQLVSSQASYQSVEQLNEQYSGALQSDAATVSKQIADHHGDELAALTTAKGLDAAANELMENSAFTSHFPDPDQRATAAQMEALVENGHADELAAVLGFGDGSITPGRNAGVGVGADTAGEGARRDAQAATSNAGGRANQAADTSNGFAQAEAGAPTEAGARDAVRGHYGGTREAIGNAEPDAEQRISENARREANDRLQQPPDKSYAHMFSGGYEDVVGQAGISGIVSGFVDGITTYDHGGALSAYQDAVEQSGAVGDNPYMQKLYGLAAYANDVYEQQGAAFAETALATSERGGLEEIHQAAFDQAKAMELTDTQADYFAAQSVNTALDRLGGEGAVSKAGFDANPEAVEAELTSHGFDDQAAENARRYIDRAAGVPVDHAESALATVISANEVMDVPGSSESALDTR